MLIEYHTLPSGLRCVAANAPIAVEHFGLAVDAGARDEAPDCHGLAHFVEHTIFKGTTRHRPSWVRDRMELIGGELNAYTTKEETVVYTTAPAGYLRRGLQLLSEMVCDANFPEAELEREKSVVGEEIDTYLDTPADAVFDDFEDIIYAPSSLAHNILGTRDDLSRLDSAACRHWLEERFTPGRMVLFYYGPEQPDRVFALAGRYFGSFRRPDTPLRREVPPTAEAFTQESTAADSFQAHTVMGTRIGGINSPDRIATALAVNILGGPGMNSLLNVALRERRGLVYTADASTQLMSDNGLLTIYFGCDPDDTRHCLRLTSRIAASLAESPLSSRRLEAAKRQFIGQLTVSTVNTEQTAISLGRSTLYRGHATHLSDTIAAINDLTPAAVLSASAPLASLSSLTLR